MSEQLIGTVTHYFGHVHVAAIEIERGELHVGDTIHIAGHTSDFTQRIGSMQIEHENVESASAGDSVGIEVGDKAREHDKVYKITPD